MAAFKGNGVTLEVDGTTVMCFRTVTMTYGGESIDISDGCSDGFRELHTESGQRQIDLSVDGVAKTTYLRRLLLGAADGIRIEGAVLTWPVHVAGDTTGDVLTMDVNLTGYTETMTYNDVTTFSVTLESSGPWVFVPGAAA